MGLGEERALLGLTAGLQLLGFLEGVSWETTAAAGVL